MPTIIDLEKIIKELLVRYHAESALLFGSYARKEATPESDIDLVVFGGDNFIKADIFSLAEDLRQITQKNADVFEICELNPNTPFYEAVMREGIKIA